MFQKFKRIYRVIIFILFTISIALFVYISNSPRIRYQPYPYHYEYTYAHRGDVDIAFMGTSRTMRAIIAPYFEERMRRNMGKEFIVYDLSRSGRGAGLEYVLVREFLENHNVKLLLVHFNDSLKEVVHPNFFKVARFNDILNDYTTHPDNFILRLNFISRMIGLKLGESFHLLLQSNYLKKVYPTNVKTSDYSFPVPVRPDVLEKALAKYSKKWKKLPHRNWNLNGPEEFRNTKYVHKLIKLAKDNKTEIIFFYIPRLYEPHISEEMISTFSTEFGIEWLQPPLNVRLDMYEPGGYTDTGHVNSRGAELYMDWLADMITQKFKDLLQ